MTQLYLNLIGNALKFTPDDRTPRIELAMREVDGVTVYTVRDNGIGIEQKYAERIFRPFQRLHARDAFEGTGIGLAICQKAVERHRGEIWVETADGAGSIFCFTLHARRPDSRSDRG